mgnify:CR=1 FL=1
MWLHTQKPRIISLPVPGLLPPPDWVQAYPVKFSVLTSRTEVKPIAVGRLRSSALIIYCRPRFYLVERRRHRRSKPIAPPLPETVSHGPNGKQKETYAQAYPKSGRRHPGEVPWRYGGGGGNQCHPSHRVQPRSDFSTLEGLQTADYRSDAVTVGSRAVCRPEVTVEPAGNSFANAVRSPLHERRLWNPPRLPRD